DFTDMIPKGGGIGPSPQMALLIQNVEESFARTVLALIDGGAPLTQALTTDTFMMTPPLMEFYAFLDSAQPNNNEVVKNDRLVTAYPSTSLTIEAAEGPIPLAQSLDPNDPSFMHWYDPDITQTKRTEADCNVDPRVYPLASVTLHHLLYGSLSAY